MKKLTMRDRAFAKKFAEALETVHEGNQPVEAVAEILREIRAKGDKAVAQLGKKFDGVSLSPKDFQLSPEVVDRARRKLPLGVRRILGESRRCVETFHRASLPKNWSLRNPHGAIVGERFYPLERVGLYIPGGNVPLVSTVLMTATLAKLAKVREIAVFTPPGPDGLPNESLLGALGLLGIKEVYRIGGVQAIGAMAYGTDSIKPVRKIFGPGNAYVVEAKRQLFGTVGIDLLPGPSEVMVIADEKADPAWVAADLLSQAEHGKGGVIFLACQSAGFRNQVEKAIRQQLPDRQHRETIESVLENGFFGIIAPHKEDMAQLANRIAPEHMELQVERSLAMYLEKNITTAGAILSGPWTPTAVGDFTAGPSHVLPTGSAGVFSSGLRMEDFYRRSSYVRYDKKSLQKAAPVTDGFSEIESLDAHGYSVQIRCPE
ncbi:MAG: histidinol dehydrogenase [Opitutales bacterium]|nr:histidinol dehydrogenase [Opitutales bacterium]